MLLRHRFRPWFVGNILRAAFAMLRPTGAQGIDVTVEWKQLSGPLLCGMNRTRNPASNTFDVCHRFWRVVHTKHVCGLEHLEDAVFLRYEVSIITFQAEELRLPEK